MIRYFAMHYQKQKQQPVPTYDPSPWRIWKNKN
jgi:hypothetical protein